jgi:hypothetical protein
MRVDLEGLTFGAVFSPGVRFYAENLLLFCIDGNRRPFSSAAGRDTTSNVLELSVAVRMINSLPRLAMALK